MTIVSLSARGAPKAEAPGGTILDACPWLLPVLALALTLLIDAAPIAETLRGRVTDPDDAMRLVEVRNWLAGQSWFDMNAMRLDPPHGSFMHWSRLVDLPVAAMIRLFGLVTDTGHAERLALVAVPALWLGALYGGMLRLSACLVGCAVRLPALVGTFLSGATLIQFGPGRIGHHAPETVALIFAAGSAVEALDPRRARQAFVCGALTALALAMSLETLPFLVALAGVLVGFWIWRGPELRATLAWFGGGLVAALPLFFLLTVGSGRWGAPICDAYGAAHLGAGLIGGAGALVLAAFTPRLGSSAMRASASAAVAGLVLAYVALAYPACLRSPFAGVDPLVRDLWLRHVVESQPLSEFWRLRPMITLALVGPVALGLAGSLAAMASLSGVAARRFALIAVLTAAGFALSLWQMRVIGSVTPIALCGGVYIATRLADRLKTIRPGWAAALAAAAILPFTSTVWVLALPGDSDTGSLAKAETKAACVAPQAFVPLAALTPGSAVAPMDSGAHLLEATRLSVFAAPYHRNDDGNRFAFEVFLAAPGAARAMLAARQVDYVMICPGMSDIDRLAARAPDGLAARLSAGAVPSFLRPLPLAGTPYKVYRVARDDG